MTNQQKMLQQLIHIKWLLVLVAVGVSISAGSWLWSTYRASTYLSTHKEEFTEKARRLLVEDKPLEVISLAENHLKNQPQDAYGPWFLAMAYYQAGKFQEALHWLDKTQELNPTWVSEYIKPYREAIKKKQQESNAQSKQK